MSSRNHLNQSEYPRKRTASTIEQQKRLASPWGFDANGNGQSEQARPPVESRSTSIPCARELEIQGLVYNALGVIEDARDTYETPDYDALIGVLTRVVTRLSTLIAERAGHSSYVAVPHELWERMFKAVCVAGGRTSSPGNHLSDLMSAGDVRAFVGELADELLAGGQQ